MGNSLDLLRGTENRIAFDNCTFSPIKELVLIYLKRCRHSQEYIDEAMSKSITVHASSTKPTPHSDYIYIQLWHGEKILLMNLKRMSDQPHWLYETLSKWGFDLTDTSKEYVYE